MNLQPKDIAAASAALIKADPSSPALVVKDRQSIAIKAGTQFNGVTFAEDTPLAPPIAGYVPGRDYVVTIIDDAKVTEADAEPDGDHVLGGFHFAPGGNASARAGGDDVPAINPFSLWDRNFRPSCPDPRGMALVEKPGGKFWGDIYLLGVNHESDGTSKFGVTIADGSDLPDGNMPDGKKFKRFDYLTAVAVMAQHGKGLLSVEEFFAAAFGVTEKTSHDSDPVRAGLDAPRTSRFGLMQATGNMWVWGHDGDPDTPRASFFGGSWWSDGGAGSRYAHVDYWPDNSSENFGARGRSDHLQLG